MGKNAMQGLIFNFAKDRVHHYQQTNSYITRVQLASEEIKEAWMIPAYWDRDVDKFAF